MTLLNSAVNWLRKINRTQRELRTFYGRPDLIPARQTQAQLLFAMTAADGRYADPLNITRCHAQVYSHNGQDGIIAEIFNRIGEESRYFVEIGIGDGTENNTRFLLERGWRGIWIDGSKKDTDRARRLFASSIAEGRLKIHCGMVYPDNINSILDAEGVPQEFDFLSLDIDYNTAHVWEAMGRRYRAACIEYNASLPASLDIVVPYKAEMMWDTTVWFGGSLKALERIGRAKSLSLVGCDILGVDAFFVRSDLAENRFRAPFNAETHYEPPRFDVTRRLGHRTAPAERSWDVKRSKS